MVLFSWSYTSHLGVCCAQYSNHFIRLDYLIRLLHSGLLLWKLFREMFRNPRRQSPRHITYIFPAPSLMYSPIHYDDIQSVVILQYRDVFQRIPVDENAICVVARLNLAELMSSHHEGSNTGSGGDDALVR